MGNRNDAPLARLVDKPTTPGHFRHNVGLIARTLLTEWVGADRANEAIGRVTNAIAASAAAARNPSDFYACTPDSVARAVATAALIGIMPSTGKSALAYVIPQRPRRNEPPQLDFMLSHRGLLALAKRSGQHGSAIPIGFGDELAVSEDGDVVVRHRDFDNPPTTWEDLRGVLMVVRDIKTGHVLSREFMPKKLIEARRAMSRSFSSSNEWARKNSPWSTWPVPMAQKTAIHYAIARGWIVIDDTEAVRALSVDSAVDEAPVRGDAEARQRQPDGLPQGATPDALRLPDNGEPVDEVAAMVRDLGREGLIARYGETFGTVPGKDLDEMAIARALLADVPPAN